MKKNFIFHVELTGVMFFLFIFLVYPVANVLFGSVFIEEAGKSHFTLIFFKLFGESPLMWRCLGNSLMLGAGATLGSILIAMPLAQWFARYDFPWKPFWQAMLMAPLILPPFVGAIGIQQLFGRFGTVNHLLGWVGPNVAHPHPMDWLGDGGFWGVVVMQSLHFFPILFLNLSSAFANLHPAMREAARSLGAPPGHLFRSITLPLLIPGLFAGSSIVFVASFTDLGTPLIFGYSQVVAVQIFDKITETGFNPFGYTLVLVVLLVTVGLFLGTRRLLAGRDYVTEIKGAFREEQIVLFGWKRMGVLLGLTTICGVILLPHASVLLSSFSERWLMSTLPQKWTLAHYHEIFTLPQAATGLRNSLFYSGISALVDVGLGTVIAYWLARREFYGKTLLDALTVLPLALPGIVLAFGYVVSFNVPTKWHGIDLSGLKSWVNPRDNPTLLLIVSYSVRRLPYVVRSAYAGLQQMSLSVEEASRNLGAGQWMTLRKIVIPLLKGNLVAGAILTFAFSFLEVSDGLILAMREPYYPVTKTIWALMGRIEPGSAGIACALGVLGMLLLWMSFYVANRFLGRRMESLIR